MFRCSGSLFESRVRDESGFSWQYFCKTGMKEANKLLIDEPDEGVMSSVCGLLDYLIVVVYCFCTGLFVLRVVC